MGFAQVCAWRRIGCAGKLRYDVQRCALCRVKLETERLPASDQTRLVYSLRLGFGRFTPSGAASGIESADVIYNLQ